MSASASAHITTPFYKKLYWQVFIGVALGGLLGYLSPEFGASLKPWGDAFIKLIKMVIAPVIFCTVVVGMAGMSDIKKMGKVGGLSIIYFEIMTTMALLLGIVAMNIFPVGIGLHIDPSTLNAESVAKFSQAKGVSFTDLIINIIPKSFISAFAENETLQVLFLAILFGIALQRLGGKANPVFQLIEASSDLFFKIIDTLMKAAPFGAFASMAFTIGKFGADALLPLAKFVLLFWATSAFFIVVIIGGLLAYYRINIFKLIALLKEEILIVFGTASSEPLIPRLIQKLQQLGIKKETSGLILPAGSAFNLDGSCLYFTMAALFLAQATDTPFPISDQITLFLVLLIASKGANAVYGSAFIILGSTLGAVGHIPVEAMAIILGIDRFMALGRSTVNMVGNCGATLVVAHYTKDVEKS